MSNGNSVTLTDPVTGEVHVHWHVLVEGKLRVTVAKSNFSLSVDHTAENIKLIRDFLTVWLERDAQRLIEKGDAR